MQLPVIRRLPVAAAVERVSAEGVGVVSLLSPLLALVAAAYMAAFFLAALFRVVYPFPLDLLTEGADLQQLEALLQGQPLYGPPTLQHVPVIYGPAYFYLSALFGLVLGPTFAPLRLVSLLASLGSLTVLAFLARRETGSWLAGLAAAGFLAATNPLVDGGLDNGHVDALLTLFMVGALFALRAADQGWWRGPWASLCAGCLLGLALLTKQAAIPLVGAAGLYLVLAQRRQLVTFVPALLLTVAIPLFLLYLQSGSWVAYYLWALPRKHVIQDILVGRFWTYDLLPHFTIAILIVVPIFFVGRLLRGDRGAVLFYGLLGLSLLTTSWLTRTNEGSGNNTLLPVDSALALLLGLSLHEGLHYLAGNAPRLVVCRAFLLVWVTLQLAVLTYNPRLMVPYRSDLWADDRLTSTLAALPGPIFAPDLDGFLRGTDKGEQAYSGAAAELVGGYGGSTSPPGEAWRSQLNTALEARWFNYVVLVPDDESGFFIRSAALASGYVDVGPLFPDGDEFWLWRTGLQPHVEVYAAPNEPLPVLPP